MDFFFFGSLRDRTLLEIVLDRTVADHDILAARAEDHATRRMADEAYPVLIPQAGSSSDGIVVRNLSKADQDRLAFFEETEYGVEILTVQTDQGPIAASYFRTTNKTVTLDTPWDYAAWCATDRAVAREAGRELMAHFGIIPAEQIDTIWTGILMRARMRVRAAGAAGVTGHARSPHGPGDVEPIAVERPYTLYFALEEHHLRHRRFDGTWSKPIQRAVLTSGDAVTVVPYDPIRNMVMLIEQFRAPLYARGDSNPWLAEAIAGRIDVDTSAEAAARREAAEEGGVTLGRLEVVAGYYPTPGFAAEHLTSFVGEADLGTAGGTFGLVDEDEDIRAFTMSLPDAVSAVASGEINAGPAVLTLLWLQLHSDRLRAAWTQPTA